MLLILMLLIYCVSFLFNVVTNMFVSYCVLITMVAGLTPAHTHMEIDPLTILGVVAGLVSDQFLRLYFAIFIIIIFCIDELSFC